MVEKDFDTILLGEDIATKEPTATGAATSAVYAKFGEAAVAGFQPVPDLLLKNQIRLGLSVTDLVVLLNILMHWWYPEQKPFPRSSTIAKRIGMTDRTVQRSIRKMEETGLLKRITDKAGPTYLDPLPLVGRLTEFAQTDADYLVRSGRSATT